MTTQRFLDYLAAHEQTRQLAFDLTEILEGRDEQVLRQSA
jgi:hypothetical protein